MDKEEFKKAFCELWQKRDTPKKEVKIYTDADGMALFDATLYYEAFPTPENKKKADAIMDRVKEKARISREENRVKFIEIYGDEMYNFLDKNFDNTENWLRYKEYGFSFSKYLYADDNDYSYYIYFKNGMFSYEKDHYWMDSETIENDITKERVMELLSKKENI